MRSYLLGPYGSARDHEGSYCEPAERAERRRAADHWVATVAALRSSWAVSGPSSPVMANCLSR